MLKGYDPLTAADTASRAAAHYCATSSLPIPDDPSQWAHGSPVAYGPGASKGKRPLVYLAGPLFNVQERWFVAEVRRCVQAMGLDVFSPFHDVGVEGSTSEIAGRDLDGLARAIAVFAIADGLDAGTMFEVGYAIRSGVPVVAYAEKANAAELTMLTGTGVKVCTDFATALYKLGWTVMSL